MSDADFNGRELFLIFKKAYPNNLMPLWFYRSICFSLCLTHAFHYPSFSIEPEEVKLILQALKRQNELLEQIAFSVEMTQIDYSLPRVGILDEPRVIRRGIDVARERAGRELISSKVVESNAANSLYRVGSKVDYLNDLDKHVTLYEINNERTVYLRSHDTDKPFFEPLRHISRINNEAIHSIFSRSMDSNEEITLRILPKSAAESVSDVVIGIELTEEATVYKIWFDSGKNFFPHKIERYFDEDLIVSTTIEPQKVDKDSWFPLFAVRTRYESNSADKAVASEFFYEFIDISIDCEMEDCSPSKFELPLEEGDLVLDFLQGNEIRYFVGGFSTKDQKLKDIVVNTLDDEYEPTKRERNASIGLTNSTKSNPSRAKTLNNPGGLDLITLFAPLAVVFTILISCGYYYYRSKCTAK